MEKVWGYNVETKMNKIKKHEYIQTNVSKKFSIDSMKKI